MIAEKTHSAINAFAIQGVLTDLQPYGTGHIHDTYQSVVRQDNKTVHFLHQRINTHVFQNIEALMHNIQKVTEHQYTKNQKRNADSRSQLLLVPTRDGHTYYTDEEKHVWRTYVFIENAVGYDIVEYPQQAQEAAKAFARFQKDVADIPAEQLLITIPYFHHTPRRINALKTAVELDKCNRAAQAKAEIHTILAQETELGVLETMCNNKSLPLRITHNDCKINNVLMDTHTNKGVCVIDLDTVMPGIVGYDFGDMMRTFISNSEEDEQNTQNIAIVPEVFEALARGYLSEANKFITDNERDSLVLSGKIITMTIATRFLTDYLSGDHYFKCHRPQHNLERCQAQLALAAAIEKNRFSMETTIHKCSKNL